MTVEKRKQLISRLLALHPDATTDSALVAERSLWLWERIASHLTPLIGETAFQALYGRAVYLALPECPGFTIFKQGDSTIGLFTRLKDDIVALEHSIAERCSNVLLGKFTELVTSMIGEVLMEQILRSAWEDHPIQAKR